MALRNLLIPALILSLPCASLADVTLVKKGKPLAAIYADAEMMSEEKKAKVSNGSPSTLTTTSGRRAIRPWTPARHSGCGTRTYRSGTGPG